MFRTELARGSRDPIVFFEATLDARRNASHENDQSFLMYLRDRYRETPPDLVVTLGAPAARFYVDERSRLFPTAPLVMVSADERLAVVSALRADDTAVIAGINGEERHAVDTGEKRPLIRKRSPLVVDKQARPAIAGLALERQGDQVAEAAFG